ncbi:MAG: hypothetical protein GY851_15745 [bacterium]|nr:hypothetical protein [bacterium]
MQMGRLALKIGLYLLLLGVCQVVVSRVWPCRELDEHRHRMDKALAGSPDVAYFADSSVEPRRSERGNGASPKAGSTCTILEGLLPGTRVAALGGLGHGQEEFLEQARYMVRSGHRPAVAVMVVNPIRVAPWDEMPGHRWVGERIALRYPAWVSNLVYRPLAAFRWFDLDPLSWREWNRIEVEVPGLGTTTAGDVFEMLAEAPDHVERGRLFYQCRAILPDRKDPELRAMAECAGLLKRAGIVPLFYVTPVDREFAREHVGEPYMIALDAQRDMAIAVLRDSGAEVFDLSHSLESDKFDPKPVPSVHLWYEGRYEVAQRLAEAIRDRQIPRL